MGCIVHAVFLYVYIDNNVVLISAGKLLFPWKIILWVQVHCIAILVGLECL